MELRIKGVSPVSGAEEEEEEEVEQAEKKPDGSTKWKKDRQINEVWLGTQKRSKGGQINA